MKLTNIGTVKSLMEKHGIKFQKQFGQNFLINEDIPARIAAESGATENDCVLEIGPGIGTLTRELCQVAGKVVAVEIDKGLIPVLSETLADFDNVEVINSDIMKTDLEGLFSEKFGEKNVYVCANLPYYITTPILMLLLESRLPIKKMTFMVQKEVADRLSSSSREGDDGAVTAVDRMLLARHRAGWTIDVPLNLYAADLDQDMDVDAADVEIFNRYFAGWANYTTLPHKN